MISGSLSMLAQLSLSLAQLSPSLLLIIIWQSSSLTDKKVKAENQQKDLSIKKRNRSKQAGAELCQAQAQQGYHAEATTKQTLD